MREAQYNKPNQKSMIEIWMVRVAKRIALIYGTIALAVYITIITLPGVTLDARTISGSMLVAALPLSWYVFPLGLSFMMHPYLPGGDQGFYPVLLAWLIYVSIIFLATFSNKRIFFFLFYILLIVVLIVNIRGCQIMPHPGH